MAASYLSGIITFSGVSTPSDLTGLTGVTVTVIGNITQYDINSSTRLVLSSTTVMTHDPNKYVIICRSPASVTNPPLLINSGAIYNYGIKTIVGSSIGYSSGAGLIFTGEGGSSLNNGSIIVLSGGTFNWNGGGVLAAASFVMRSGCIINQFSGSFINLNNTYTFQFRIESANSAADLLININDLTLDSYANVESRLLTTSGFNVGVFTFKKASFQTYLNYQPALLFLNFNNLNTVSSADVFFNSSLPSYASTVTFRNCSKEVSFIEVLAGTKSGYAKIERAISLSFLNTDDTDAGEVVVYGKDFNNSSRFIGPQGQDDVADKIYSASQNSPITFNILRNIVNLVQGRTPQRYDDSRTNGNGNIPLVAFSYKSIFITINAPLLGLNTFTQSYYLPTDALITETNRTITDAYTELNTTYKAYDFAKSFLFDNFTGQRQTIITRSGNVLIATPYNIVIDATAVNVFAFDGTNITIKTSNFIGDITTTGIVTMTNGATITGNISDANGDSNIAVTTPSGYEDNVVIYPTLVDAEAETNQIGSGLNFRYLSSVYGDTNIWYRMTALDGSYIIENYLVPAGAGNYSVSLVVTSENAALGSIKAVTDKLDAMIEVISGQQAFKATALQNSPINDLTGLAKESTVIGLY